MDDKDVKAFVDNFLLQLPAFTLDFLGKRLPKKKLTKKQMEKAYKEIGKLLLSFEELYKLSNEPPKSQAEVIARLDKINEILRPTAGVPHGIHLADYSWQFFLTFINAPLYWGFYKKTNYRKYRNQLNEIVYPIFRQKDQLAEGFLNEFETSPDGTVIAQSSFMVIQRQSEYLCYYRRRFNKRQIDRLIEIYRQMSGLYEKFIRVIVGFIEIEEGKEPNYEHIKKNSLSSNIKRVSKKYPILTEDFNLTVRNSIAHTTYFVSLSYGTIKFIDSNSEVTLSFSDFFRLCRLITTLVVSLSTVRYFFLYYRCKYVWEMYKSAKKIK